MSDTVNNTASAFKISLYRPSTANRCCTAVQLIRGETTESFRRSIAAAQLSRKTPLVDRESIPSHHAAKTPPDSPGLQEAEAPAAPKARIASGCVDCGGLRSGAVQDAQLRVLRTRLGDTEDMSGELGHEIDNIWERHCSNQDQDKVCRGRQFSSRLSQRYIVMGRLGPVVNAYIVQPRRNSPLVSKRALPWNG